MSSGEAVGRSWTQRRWGWILAGGLIAHTGLVWWFGERPEPLGVVAAPDPVAKLAVDAGKLREVLGAARFSDPTLFALPSARGFSGTAWVRPAPPPISWPEWSEAPRWLPLETNELAAVFTRFLDTNKHPESVVDDVLQPRITTADVLLFNDFRMTQSVVTIEGPLAKRSLAAPLVLRNPAHADVLPDTVIHVQVNHDGLVESVFLMESCGLRSADEQALAAAWTARFEPLPAAAASQSSTGPTIEGKLHFRWFTEPDAD